MTDELDAFITRHTEQDGNGPRFVPTILENVTYGLDNGAVKQPEAV